MKTSISQVSAPLSQELSSGGNVYNNSANAVAPEAVTFNQNISQFGSVSELDAGNADFFTLEFVPAGTESVTYVIGDPDGIIEAASDQTWEEPTRSGTSTVAAIKAQFNSPFFIVGINYEVTSAAQFAQKMKLVGGNTSGTFVSKPINVSGAQRNTQYNDKLLTIKFPGGLRFDRFSAMTIKVLPGQSVILTFFVGAYQG